MQGFINAWLVVEVLCAYSVHIHAFELRPNQDTPSLRMLLFDLLCSWLFDLSLSLACTETLVCTHAPC